MTTHHDPHGPVPIGDEPHRTVQELLGAHALGHLDDTERAAVDDHVAGCRECRDELALLQPLAGPFGTRGAGGLDIPDDARVGAVPAGPDPSDDGFAEILARIRAERPAPRRLVSLVETGPLPVVTAPPATEPPTTEPPGPGLDAPTVETAPTALAGTPTAEAPRGGESGESGDATVRPLPRRSRWVPRVAVAAAALVLALAGLGAGLGLAGGLVGPSGEAVAVQALDPGVSASADVIAHTWGVEVDIQATGFVPGRTYQVAVLDASGRAVGAGAFLGTGEREMRCRLNASILRGDASGFVVTDTAGAPVLTSRFT